MRLSGAPRWRRTPPKRPFPMASQAPTDREPSAPAPSLFDVLTPLLRRWRMMIVIPSVCGAAAGAVSLVLPPGYTATTSFTTDLSPGIGPSGLGGLASLAGQFGISGLT